MNAKLNKNVILKYVGWFIVSFYVFFQFLIQTSSSLMQKDWMQYFNLTPLSVSTLSAAFFYTYLLLQIPVGLIYDRFSSKGVLSIASFFLSVGCILFAFSPTYSIAVFSRMLMGAGAAFGFIGMLKVTFNLFPGKQFSIMMGLSESFAAIATMGGVVVLAWLLAHSTWQHVTIECGVVVLMITAAVLVFIRPNKPMDVEPFNWKSLSNNILKACTSRIVLITGIYGFFMASVVNAFTSLWGVAFLTNAYPITALQAAKIMSTIFFGLAVGCPINGYLSKKFGKEIVAMQICSVVCAILMFIIIYVKVPVGLLSPLFFAVGLMCAVYVQCFAIVGQTVPGKIQATSMSVTNMLIMAGAPLLQILIGALLHHQAFGFAHTSYENYKIALGILPAGMLIAYGLCFFIRLEADSIKMTHISSIKSC